jgi:hypothetical protein
MTDDRLPNITDKRLLAALKEVNPPIEKLMADRFELRQEMRRKEAELEAERQRVARWIALSLRSFRKVWRSQK